MKNEIKEFAFHLDVDDIGFAAVKDYRSPLSTPVKDIFPEAKSIIVLAFRELDNCESENKQIIMHGKMNGTTFARSCNYRVARFIQKKFKAKVMSVQNSFPIKFVEETKMAVGDVSLRHAAVAAGLGCFGRHNLVIHPQMGSRVTFNAILTNLEFTSDPPAKELCANCNICVENCPGGALAEEGKTDHIKCMKASQPYGFREYMKFWLKFTESTAQERKEMLRNPHFFRLYQAPLIGFQYTCFNCVKVCPIGQE